MGDDAMDKNQNNAPDNGALDPIVPIDFTPNEVVERKFSYKFHWFHLLVAFVVIVSTVSGWFVLTARSVFVEVEPITEQLKLKVALIFAWAKDI